MNKNLKKFVAATMAVAMLVPAAVMAHPGHDTKEHMTVTDQLTIPDPGKAKNIIFMIPDGGGTEALTLARWVDEDHHMNLDDMATGLVRTSISSKPIADSAPTATAYACGVKTQAPYLGTYGSEDCGMPGFEYDSAKANMPIATILEAAHRQGKSTGLVATSNIQHATPAAYSSHTPNRKLYELIAEQQVYENIDVILGGGEQYLQADKRKDGEDLIGVIKEMGYDYVTDTQSMKDSKSDKLWGMFAADGMKKDIDRDPAKEPSLAEMTDKALEILSKNDNGFFVMIEGSQVDWAEHQNEPVGAATDYIAYDKAVGVAKQWADKLGDTVVISVADHACGGISINNYNHNKDYMYVDLEEYVGIIKNAKFTGDEYARRLNAAGKTEEAAIALAKEGFGIDLTEEEVKHVLSKKSFEESIGNVISKRSSIGWTTLGHTGGDVGLYVYNTSNARTLKGTVHNSQLGQYTIQLMGAELEPLTQELFQPMRDEFEKKGAKVEFEWKEDGNHMLKATKGDKVVEFPMDKNYAMVNGKKVELGGLTVSHKGKTWVPAKAFSLID